MNRQHPLAYGGKSADEAEKPFWISYADLMTALMILFLVVMVVALTSVTQKAEKVISEDPIAEARSTPTDVRDEEIKRICNYLAGKSSTVNNKILVDCNLNRINFGDIGQFKSDDYALGAEGQRALTEMVPLILQTAQTELGKKWLKQVVIEGFTDTDGSYLYNLHLSLKRSEWVMCTILKNTQSEPQALTPDQRRQVKKLFLAGGVAFNNARDSKDASRRVEFRLQFYGPDDSNTAHSIADAKFEDDPNEKCMI